MKRVLGLTVLLALCMVPGPLALTACGGEQESPEPASPSSSATSPSSASAPPHAAAEQRGDAPTEVEMVASMEAHYGVVILAHDALIHGDLETFRTQLAAAADLALPASAPEAWQALHDRLRTAAAGAADADDLAAAAGALTAVVSACGTCHAALARGPIYPAPAPGAGATVIETAMLDHQWATERLWEGVTGPWDNAWERGADALAVIQVFGNVGPEVILSDELRRREAELREIGREAKGTKDLDARAALYARLLSTCGGCHQEIGVRFR